MKARKTDKKKLLRTQRVSLLLNDSEMRALNNYCKRHKITNRSNLIRSVLMKTIVSRQLADSPTLFD